MNQSEKFREGVVKLATEQNMSKEQMYEAWAVMFNVIGSPPYKYEMWRHELRKWRLDHHRKKYMQD